MVEIFIIIKRKWGSYSVSEYAGTATLYRFEGGDGGKVYKNKDCTLHT